MRTVLLGDIVASARALPAVQSANRKGLLDMLIQQAHVAHSFNKRLSKPHPHWGNGSLMSRANLEAQMVEPIGSEPDYLLALQIVIGALVRKRCRPFHL